MLLYPSAIQPRMHHPQFFKIGFGREWANGNEAYTKFILLYKNESSIASPLQHVVKRS
jgi:hypothetical protein